ncbi:hypothetical protein AB0B50_03280 [Streptomyces sp. NPDC041068]|uniref:hypothetical protein n=1 Tax=Streptomyces sp. NPDC041068 TaxID=3155130 RepID=UPI0033FD067A
MFVVAAPLMPAGYPAGAPRPSLSSLPVEGGAVLRPWLLRDAAAVVKAFQDPDLC